MPVLTPEAVIDYAVQNLIRSPLPQPPQASLAQSAPAYSRGYRPVPSACQAVVPPLPGTVATPCYGSVQVGPVSRFVPQCQPTCAPVSAQQIDAWVAEMMRQQQALEAYRRQQLRQAQAAWTAGAACPLTSSAIDANLDAQFRAAMQGSEQVARLVQQGQAGTPGLGMRSSLGAEDRMINREVYAVTHPQDAAAQAWLGQNLPQMNQMARGWEMQAEADRIALNANEGVRRMLSISEEYQDRKLGRNAAERATDQAIAGRLPEAQSSLTASQRYFEQAERERASREK